MSGKRCCQFRQITIPCLRFLPQCNTHNEDGLVGGHSTPTALGRPVWLRYYATPRSHLLDTLLDSSASRLWGDVRFFIRKHFSTDGTQFQLQRKQLKRANGKATDNTSSSSGDSAPVGVSETVGNSNAKLSRPEILERRIPELPWCGR